MKIAMIGSRGYPFVYSGYETFVTELAPRLVAAGHAVTVYCHKNLFASRPRIVNGVKLIYLPTIRRKSLNQLVHSCQAVLHACLKRFDVLLVMNSANGPFGLFTRIFRQPAVINIDGLEWQRPKWRGLGGRYFYWASRQATRFFDAVVADSGEMQKVYQREFGCPAKIIAYGASLNKNPGLKFLRKWNLRPRQYYLVLGRLIPDNNGDLIVREFLRSASRRRLVVVGDVPYPDKYSRQLKQISDPRLIFAGTICHPRQFDALYHNCFAYLHGHEFGGTNPTLLHALAAGCAILALDSVFSREVLDGDRFGMFFSKRPGNLAGLIDELEKKPALLAGLRKRAPKRILQEYTWEKIAAQYIQLFQDVVKQRRCRVSENRNRR